jgi:hypothetical protein
MDVPESCKACSLREFNSGSTFPCFYSCRERPKEKISVEDAKKRAPFCPLRIIDDHEWRR